MIPFDEIESRLAALGKDRSWLAANTPYSGDYLRTVLAPNSNRRTKRVLQVISDAIEGEARRQKEMKTAGVVLPDRISIVATPQERESWEACSLAARLTLSQWAVEKLNEAAKKWVEEEGKADGTNG